MQNEKDYLNYCNEFLHIHDFEKFFYKNGGAFLVYEILIKNVCIFWIDYYKYFLLVYLFD